MRLVHRHTFINTLPKNSCFLLSTFVFTVILSPSEIQSPCVVHKCTSLCSLFQTALCSLFPPPAAVARLPQVPSYFLLQFVIAVTASDGDCYLSNFRPRQCGLFIVILSSTLSLKTVVFFYPLLFLRLLSARLKYSRLALCINALPDAPYFRQRFAPFLRHRRRSQGYLKSRHRLLVQIKRGLILKHQSSFNGASDGT